MLVSNSQKINPEFDLEQAKRFYTEGSFEPRPSGDNVTSPYDLFAIELLRDRYGLREGRQAPCDVFVFGKGEAPRRYATKVGGLPYWPANRPWPKARNGTPYRFLAQLNFADSQDLFVDLPGRVLVLLVDEGDDWLFEPDRIYFEWISLGIEPVVTFDISLIVNRCGEFFGAIYRSADYPDTVEKAERSNIKRYHSVPIIDGTKIGGMAHFIQGEEIEGEFLCQFNSIQAAYRVPYPWVNDPRPLDQWTGERGIFDERNKFVFLDMGNIYIFRNKDGTLKSLIESY